MSKVLLSIICLLLFSTVSAQVTPSFEGWIAYPIINDTEVYAPSRIGLVNPETGEERQLDVGNHFDPESLMWSPDYTQLSFWSSNRYSIDVLSGEIIQLTHEQVISYSAWASNGMIAYLRREAKNHLIVIDTEGNILHDINSLDIHHAPITFSPDNRYVIFQVDKENKPYLYSLDIVTGIIQEIMIEDDDGGIIESGIIIELFSREIDYSDIVIIDMDAHQGMRVSIPDFYEYSPVFVLANQFLLYHIRNEAETYSGLQLLNLQTRETIDFDLGNLMGFDTSPNREMLAYITRHETFSELCIMSLITFEDNCLDVAVFFYGKPAWSS